MTRAFLLAVGLLAASARAQTRVAPVGEAGAAGVRAAVSVQAAVLPLQKVSTPDAYRGAVLAAPASAPVPVRSGARLDALASAPSIAAAPAAPAALPVAAAAPMLERPSAPAPSMGKNAEPAPRGASSARAPGRREVRRELSAVAGPAERSETWDRTGLDALFDGALSAAADGSEPPSTRSNEPGDRLEKPAVPSRAPAAHPVPAPADAAVLKKAGAQVAGWVAAAAAFGAGVHHFLGGQAFGEYLTTYVIEWSMSLDNLVVISSALLAVPAAQRAKALRWGLIGTIGARLAMVTGGVGLVAAAHWVFAAFGVFLLATALKMAAPKLNLLGLAAALLRKLLPKGAGRLGARLSDLLPARLRTPFALGVAAVAGYGVIFALDSVPASLAISKSWFVIFSANAFSVMGLGALFSVIAWMNDRFQHLPKGVAAVLAFVGGKMLAEAAFGLALGSAASLAVIAVMLGGSVVWSLAAARRSPTPR